MVVSATQIVAPPPVNSPPTRQPIMFRDATVERTDLLTPESGTITTSTQRIDRTVEGSGYVYGLALQIVATAAGNGAAVAYQEDSPWSAFDTIVFKDVNGELINLAGFDLFIANLANHNYALRYYDQSTDTSIFQTVTGAGATGGSFTTWLDLPVAINRRELLGLVGNQDRAQKYSLRSDVAASGSIYSVAPTALPPFAITKVYYSYSVPAAQGPLGNPQQSVPSNFGTLHFLSAVNSDAAPIGGATINHFVRRIGNTVRWIALIFRSNGSRATAQTAANQPSNILFKIGDDTIFNETYTARRKLMFQRYGFDWPNGILLYETIHDFTSLPGYELGTDWWNTQSINNAQFQITYPSGFGSTNNTLKIVVDDLQLGSLAAMPRSA